MIKKIKIELIVICALLLGVFISSIFNFNSYNLKNEYGIIFNSPYLKDFFINITEIGNSFWFFLISFIVYFFCIFLEKLNTNTNIKRIKKGSLFFFTSLLVTGVLTQIIKHIIGRPRPNYFEEMDLIGVNFFSFESAFHSFPSGHTSTIFIVALFLSIITPKIKYFYYFFALIVGLSRVIVGAHYFTDVLAGIVVAFIGLKLTFYFFNKFKSTKNISNSLKTSSNIIFLSLVVFLISIIFLTVGSSLDLFVSKLFYKGNKVFILQSFSNITFLARDVFLPFLVLYILVLPIISMYTPIKKIYFGFKFKLKNILFLWATSFINIILIINLLLKNLWGRARPNDILALDGSEDFTPWYQISDSCASNCSFVSGDASVGFSLITLFFLTKNKNFYWLALISGLFLGSIRILEGGHFLSDVIVGGCVVFLLTYLLHVFYIKQLDREL